VLLKTNKLSSLQKLFTKIIVPKAVYQEITAKEQEKQIFDKTDWLEIRDIKNSELNNLLKKLIDKAKLKRLFLPKN
jgi:predicted nucleic acid-binding protein